MAKKEKSDERKKVEQFIKTVNYNRNNVPGFNSLVKLIVWFGFILLLLVLISVFSKNNNNTQQQETTTIPANSVSYKSLLDERIKDGSSYIIKYHYQNVKSTYECRIEANIKGTNIEGLLESSNGLEKFRIKDNKYYTLKFDEETEKNDNTFDLNIVNLVDLIKLLESNKALKTVDTETNIINYKYELTINNVAYEINTKIEDKKVSNISVKDVNHSYEISFK